MAHESTKIVDEIRIGKGHKLRLIDDESAERITVRIDRPAGTGLPLYDTMTMTYDESQAMLQALMDAVG
jgi:hypothetical protein